MTHPTSQQTFAAITGAEGAVQDIDQAEARNGLRHVMSLSMTKVADGLIDPKLVLAWLLTALSLVIAASFFLFRQSKHG